MNVRAWLVTALTVVSCGAATAATTVFPPPARPVAPIVSPTWGDLATRDRAREVEQIVARLRLRSGMTVADIGAGDGYDTLRLSAIVGPGGSVVAEDVMAAYLQALRASAKARRMTNVRTVLGTAADPRLAPASIDAAIMVHMYHEIQHPYALLYNLAPAFRAGGLLGVEELDRPTQFHGTPPALLTCELQAVGYRRLSLAPLSGNLGYFAIFAPPKAGERPRPGDIKACGA